jgi:hypothetical protein
VGCSGTAVAFDSPIGISNGEQADPQLVGAWRLIPMDSDASSASDASVFLFVFPPDDPTASTARQPRKHHQALFVETEVEGKAEGGWFVEDVIIGKAGEHAFMNFRRVRFSSDDEVRRTSANNGGDDELLDELLKNAPSSNVTDGPTTRLGAAWRRSARMFHAIVSNRMAPCIYSPCRWSRRMQ